MTLVTSFSLEELDYLNSLPEEVTPRVNYSVAEQQASARRAWSRMGGDATEGGWVQCNGHAVFCHEHDGAMYYRHGEMLCKVSPVSEYMDDAQADAFQKWLDSCHAMATVR